MLFYRVCHQAYRNITDEYHVGPYCTEGLDHSGDLDRMYAVHNRNAFGPDATHPPMLLDVNFPDSDCSDEYEDENHECTEYTCQAYSANYVCGFTDLERLTEWFAGFRTMLRREGFVVRVFDIPDHMVMNGRRQSVAHTDGLYAAYVSGNVQVLPVP